MLCVIFLSRQNKLLSTPSKTRGRPPGSKCPYDLGRMDVEWLTALNRSRQNKGLMELEESTLEKAIAYIENKVFCHRNAVLACPGFVFGNGPYLVCRLALLICP